MYECLFYNKYASSHKTVGTHSAISFSSLFFLKRFQHICNLQEGLKIQSSFQLDSSIGAAAVAGLFSIVSVFCSAC